MHIVESLIKNCSLILGQFDWNRVHALVTLYHHQSSASQLTLLSNDVKEKFENLLTVKSDDDKCDTPLTRIELSIMNHFKSKFLAEPILNPENKSSKSNINFSLTDELNLAYCYLLAQIDDRIEQYQLSELKFSMHITMPVAPNNLFEIFQASNVDIANFFLRIDKCRYFQNRYVVIVETINQFQSFIKRYEDFLITFQKQYHLSPENGANYTQIDAIMNQENNQQISSTKTNNSQSNESFDEICHVQYQQSAVPPVPSSIPVNQSRKECPAVQLPKLSPKKQRKGLCVIINITKFIHNGVVQTDKRAGSEKDVELIHTIFIKLNFTVLQCGFDFQERHCKQAFQEIDNEIEYGHYDCLVMFIMSHGLLHSFFTADQKAIVIRDIIKRYSDSSPTTIWKGKTRLFFIQACRSPWPDNIQSREHKGVEKSDLSPKMLVAYSCGEKEASKRSPKDGSIFIQLLCIIILRYGHSRPIDQILDLTRDFVTKFGELRSDTKKKEICIQRPEYIDQDMDNNFRFSSSCLFDQYPTWDEKSQFTIKNPHLIFSELYSNIYGKKLSIRN